MLLVVDAGNTRIKWGLVRERQVIDQSAFAYKGTPFIEALMQAWSKLQPPARVLVANVAGVELAGKLTEVCRRRFDRIPEFVQPKAKACGVTNAYPHPAQLGADRWAAIIGAYHIYGGPTCIVSCGTAITVDTVARDGSHLGGMITAGVGVMQSALADVAPVIPREPADTLNLYARDTRTAVCSGVLYAAAGFIDRSTMEIQQQQGPETTLLLTGGDAERIRAVVHGRFTLAPHLVLEGLALLGDEQT